MDFNTCPSYHPPVANISYGCRLTCACSLPYYPSFARIIPLYYLCNLLALPELLSTGLPTLTLLLAAFTTFLPIASLFTLIPSNSPTVAMCSFPYDAPAWTVCTLAACWAFFPRWLRKASRLTDEELAAHITYCYYLQVCCLEVFGRKEADY